MNQGLATLHGAPCAVIGSLVLCRDEADGEVEEFTIVPNEEADFTKNRISADSPFGRALLGRSAGDRVPISTPGGVRTVRVLVVDQGP